MLHCAVGRQNFVRGRVAVEVGMCNECEARGAGSVINML